MNLLAIDTSTDICCVSLYHSNKGITTSTEKVISSHTQLLASFVDEIIKQNNFSIKRLNHIILSIGPGSYSGLRTASSFAKGLAYAIDKNIIAINTIEALNFAINDINEYYIALYSHKDYVYYQKFCDGQAIEKQYCDRVQNLDKIKFYGYGLENFQDINSTEIKPSSVNLIKYILENDNLLVKRNISEVAPIYLTKNN